MEGENQKKSNPFPITGYKSENQRWIHLPFEELSWIQEVRYMSVEAFHCLNSFPEPHARDQQVVSVEETNLRYKEKCK